MDRRGAGLISLRKCNLTIRNTQINSYMFSQSEAYYDKLPTSNKTSELSAALAHGLISTLR